jgi:hypothetical protein
MPSWLMFEPIHIHKTPGLAEAGGFRKMDSGSVFETDLLAGSVNQ